MRSKTLLTPFSYLHDWNYPSSRFLGSYPGPFYVTLIPQGYGCGKSTAAYIWYQRHTSIDFLDKYCFGCHICPRTPDIHSFFFTEGQGTLPAGSWLCRSQIFWGSCWLQPGVYPLLISGIRIIIPHRWSWRETCQSFLSGLIDRSKRSRREAESTADFILFFSSALPLLLLSLVLALSLQRFYLWERISNADIKLSRF